MKLSSLVLPSATAGLFCLMALSSPANLVSNGSFETGDFTGWNIAISPLTFVDGGPSGSVVFAPHDGNYYALFGNTSVDAIDQQIATTPGASYDVNFWMNDQYGGSDLVVKWGGATLWHYSSTSPNPSPNGWVDVDLTAVASAASMDLSFFVSTQTAFGLDAVSVPDPTGLGCFLGSVGGLIAIDGFRRRGRATAS